MSGPPPPQRVPVDVAAARQLMKDITLSLETTITRALALSEDERNQRVNGEWSTIESVRHLIFVIDVWLGRTINGEADPFHPIGLPPHFVPRQPPGSSVDPEARPTFDVACDALRGRLAALAAFLDGLTEDELGRSIGGHAETVAGGLGVIFDEVTFHNGFMNRDLAVIEGARA